MKLLFKLFICFSLISRYSITFSQEPIKFFPDKIFNENKDANDFRVNWYSKHLISMDEPSLWEMSRNTNKEIYRFLWLRTFDSPISIRIEIDSKEKCSIYVKRTNGYGGYEAGDLINNYVTELKKDSLKIFFDLINTSNFWNLPTKEDSFGPDGSQWIIEGIRNGKYHIVDRWAPGKIYKVGLYFLKISNLDYGKIY